MSSLPQPTINTQSVAFQFGVTDAQRGESCVPEMIFLQHQQQVEYAAGWESIKGVTATTAQFTGSKLPAPAPVAKSHNWHDHNANVAIARIEAHQRRQGRAYELSCAFLGADCGDIIFMAV